MRKGIVAGLAIGPPAKILKDPPNVSIFQIGRFTSAVQHGSTLWAFEASGAAYRYAETASSNPQDEQISTVMLPTFSCACDGKLLRADFVSSRLKWTLPCVAKTVGCWQAAQVWDIGRGVRLLGRSRMIGYFRAAMSHGSSCSMWLWRTLALLNAQWKHFEASVCPICACGRHTCYVIN